MKPFSKWTVEEEFQLTLEPHFQGLQSWLQGASQASPDETAYLQQLSRKLALHVRDWNEEELKVYFIALILWGITTNKRDYSSACEYGVITRFIL